jgi:N-acetylneuraminate synthase
MESDILARIKNNDFVLIAEIGVNYYDIALKNNSSLMEAAKYMIDEAKRARIHAVKFQAYKAETLASKYSPSYWDLSEEPTNSQYALFKKYDFFAYPEYAELSEYCKKIGIEFFATPFDFESADYLEELMNIYKISSSDVSNIPFIEYIAKKNKPIILSVGASNRDEIDIAVNTIKKYNEQPLIIMHCILEYPTPYEHTNLNKIKTLKDRYKDAIIGYSDHAKPDLTYDVIKTAYNLGAAIIEKHFTLDKTLIGNDHYHAMDVKDAMNILDSIGYLNLLRGSGEIICLDSELKARENARRSIISFGKIYKGEIITEQKIIYKRPGTGISPYKVSEILGKRVNCDIEDDTILDFKMLI